MWGATAERSLIMMHIGVALESFCLCTCLCVMPMYYIVMFMFLRNFFTFFRRPFSGQSFLFFFSLSPFLFFARLNNTLLFCRCHLVCRVSGLIKLL